MEPEIRQLVETCRQSFERIQALLEWRNLEMDESRRAGAPHVGVETTRRDVASEMLRFESLSGRVWNESLQLPRRKREALRNWVTKLRLAVAGQIGPQGL